ncbi:MAG: thermonuclease family protein [Candidatus Omnitrophica bacterium]|nr:thermonuclease family protein [Candidatus Omnitrophota bacterium]
MPNELVTARYEGLLQDIADIYTATRQAMAEAYWNIGQRIVRVDQDGDLRAAYGDRLLERLSQDLLKRYNLGFSVPNLERMRKFYLSHPKSSAPRELTWSHYVELLGVTDDKTRRRLEKLAAKEGLTTRELRRLVKEEEGSGDASDLGPLTRSSHLMLNTYAFAYPVGMEVPQGSQAVDLGFCVQVVLSDEALKGVKLMERPCYTYPASIERVVDGDTFLVEVDLGFGVSVRERLRLRGIDCPELKTKEGQKAKEEMMRRLQRGSRVVIRSHKTDIYGRFVADVFYIPDGENDPEKILAEGIFLNQELVDQGFAVRMK